MVHTMDEIEDWEIIQASINQDFFSLDPPINHTSFGEEQLNSTNDNSPLLNHYREPEQLRNNRLVLPDGEHESTETEGDAVVSDQERNSVGKEAAGRKKPWPVVWWKSQLYNLFKYFGVVGISCKPAWCMSVVTAVISFVVLRKRVFGMKYNRKSVTTSRKKETQFVASTVQLNQTLSVVRRIPVIKIIPHGAMEIHGLLYQ